VREGVGGEGALGRAVPFTEGSTARRGCGAGAPTDARAEEPSPESCQGTKAGGPQPGDFGRTLHFQVPVPSGRMVQAPESVMFCFVLLLNITLTRVLHMSTVLDALYCASSHAN